MEIKHVFSPEERKNIREFLFETIHNEPELTDRSRADIDEMISQDFAFVACEANQIRGFILKKPLGARLFELISWYVLPSFRNQGIGSKLLREAIKNHSHETYLATTFNTKTCSLLQHNGFKKTSWNTLPITLSIRYLISRKVTSIAKHLFKKKSYLLIRTP